MLAITERASSLTHPIIERAVTLVSWYLGEALRLAYPATLDPQLLQAHRLISWLIQNHWETFDASSLSVFPLHREILTTVIAELRRSP